MGCKVKLAPEQYQQVEELGLLVDADDQVCQRACVRYQEREEKGE